MQQDKSCLDDQLLMERLVNDKDSRACELLYLKYYSRLRGYIARRSGSTRDAEDLAQCVFVHLWETHARYERGGSVEAYFFRVANNAIAGHGRARRRQVRDKTRESIAAETADIPGADASADQAFRARVFDIIADERIRISAKAREALRLRFIEGLSTAEASRTIGCSRTAFYARLERAVKALRGWMSCNRDQ